MTLPPLTAEKRAAAVAEGARARAVRAKLCADLKSGRLGLADVLDRAEHDDALARLKVTALLESMPGIGRVKAGAVLDRIGIAPTRRLRGLGSKQRAALRNEFPRQ